MVWTYERVQVQTKMKYISFVFRFYQRALHSYTAFLLCTDTFTK